MQHDHTTTPTPEDARLDEQLRASLEAASTDTHERDWSRRVAAHALDDVIAAESRRRSPRIRPRRLPALAAAGGLAAALLVAGALAPGSRDGDASRGAATPFAPADASAAEVLERAAERMLATDPGGTAGTGSTWHSIARGSDGGVHETWYDAERRAARWVAYHPSDSSIGTTTSVERHDGGTYYVLDARSDGSGTIRQYVRQADGAWAPAPGGAQMESASGPASLGIATVEGEAIAWLQAVGASSSAAQMRAANARFVERTAMWFTPPMDGGRPGEPSAAGRAMQALYLMRIARLEPQAVAQLYRDVADLESLERLDDDRVDGRDVMRVRLFRAPAEDPDMLETILLLDARTGAPLGTTTEQGSRSTTFEQAVRTERLGAEAESCGTGVEPPCELLEGTGPIAAAADRIATDVGAPVDPTPGPGRDEVVASVPAG